MVKDLGKELDVDESYYVRLVDEALDAIGKYGNPDLFVNTVEYVEEKIELPWRTDEELAELEKKEHPKDSDEENYHGTS